MYYDAFFLKCDTNTLPHIAHTWRTSSDFENNKYIKISFQVPHAEIREYCI